MAHHEPTSPNNLSGHQNICQRHHPNHHLQHHHQNQQLPSPNANAFRHRQPSQTFSSHSQKPHPSFLNTTNPRQSNHGDDDEALAKKKKNADAQAAFRQRRQTYIRSLEDTVAELKRAVSEMELIVRTTSHEIKVQREQVSHLEGKLLAYETGKLAPSGCTCSSLLSDRVGSGESTNGINTNGNIRNGTARPGIQSPASGASSSFNFSKPLNGSADPSNPLSATSGDRNWTSLQLSGSQTYSDTFNSSAPLPNRHHQPNLAHHRTGDASDPQPALGHPNNDSTNVRPGSSDMGIFGSFDASPQGHVLHQSGNSVSSSRSTPTHNLPGHSSPRLSNSLEVESHSNPAHHPVISPFDRSSAPGTTPITPSYSHHLVQQRPSPFDTSSSLSAPSPRVWGPTTPQNIPLGHYGQTGGSDAMELDASPKPDISRVDGTSLVEVDKANFRWQSSDRPLIRSSDYLPSLGVRSALPTPDYAHSFPPVDPITSSIESIKGRNFLSNKRRRGWEQEGLEATEMTDEGARLRENSLFIRSGILGGTTINKLTGLPAKVARCEQAVLEVSQVLSQAKEEAQSATRVPANVAPTHDGRKSSGQSPTKVNGQPSSHSDSSNVQATGGPDNNADTNSDGSSKFSRMKRSGPFSGTEGSVPNSSATFQLTDDHSPPSNRPHDFGSGSHPESGNLAHSTPHHDCTAFANQSY